MFMICAQQVFPDSAASCTAAFRHKDGGIVTISKFDLGDGQPRLVFVDFRTGYIRILTQAADEFVAGPTLLSDAPVELHTRCMKDELDWKISNNPPDQARRISIREEQVQFSSSEIRLSGTLYLPDGPSPHSTIVLLHGSGPLTRYSFGPIPYFFAASGVAVLIYDKRGTGQSTGKFDDATLDDLANDGAAAIAYLKTRKDVDPNRIGLWGSSQGGFLAAAVAARTTGLRFLMNHSGMYVPVWQQEIYRTKSEMQAEGYSEKEIATALDYLNEFFGVARSGKNWETLEKKKTEIKDKKWFDLVAKADDLKTLRWYWETLYSYDPEKPLEKVKCPVLAVFGGLDKSTPVPESITNMKRALAKAGNSNFEYRIFSNADHGMLEAKTGADTEIPNLTQLVAEAFELQRQWILANK